MTMRATLLAALRRDPDLVPKVTKTLRGRIAEEEGRISTVVQAAEALEPVIADAVSKRPSRLNKLGLKSAQLLAGLAAEDQSSNRALAAIARGTTVGLVFVDVANFTTLTAERGDEAAIRILNRLVEIVETKTTASRGECVKHLGDGFLLAFPSASQGVRGAVNVREAVRRERARNPHFDIALRIAVHAGEPLVQGDDLLGHDVNLAARLLDHCKPDQIIVSEAAKELAAKRLRKITFGNKRLVKIRGLTTKIGIHAVNDRDRLNAGEREYAARF